MFSPCFFYNITCQVRLSSLEMSPTVFKAGATVVVLGDAIALMAHPVAVALVVGSTVLLPDRDGLPDLDLL
jgi:hypothetical protein